MDGVRTLFFPLNNVKFYQFLKLFSLKLHGKSFNVYLLHLNLPVNYMFVAKRTISIQTQHRKNKSQIVYVTNYNFQLNMLSYSLQQRVREREREMIRKRKRKKGNFIWSEYKKGAQPLTCKSIQSCITKNKQNKLIILNIHPLLLNHK